MCPGHSSPVLSWFSLHSLSENHGELPECVGEEVTWQLPHQWFGSAADSSVSRAYQCPSLSEGWFSPPRSSGKFLNFGSKVVWLVQWQGEEVVFCLGGWLLLILQQLLGSTVKDLGPILWGAVLTRNKNTVPVPESSQSRYRTRCNRWTKQANRGVEGRQDKRKWGPILATCLVIRSWQHSVGIVAEVTVVYCLCFWALAPNWR